MPRNVRNFWLELEIDGRPTKIAAGPRASDGGFTLHIGIREDGGIADQRLVIFGSALPDGTLTVTADVIGKGANAQAIILKGRR